MRRHVTVKFTLKACEFWQPGAGSPVLRLCPEGVRKFFDVPKTATVLWIEFFRKRQCPDDAELTMRRVRRRVHRCLLDGNHVLGALTDSEESLLNSLGGKAFIQVFYE